MGKKTKFTPVCVYDAMGYIRLLRIAAEQVGDVIGLISWDTTKDYVHSFEIAPGMITEYGVGKARYIIAESNLIHEAARMRDKALRYGATPEAIRLLGLVCPVTKMECEEMAEKLKAKGGAAAKSGGKAAAKGDAEALKAAAKTAPVGGKKAATEAPKKRGNPEALAKAREARAAGPDTRKITVVGTAKEHLAGVREGSYRGLMLAGLFRSKTVQAFKELEINGKHPTSGDLKYAVDAGFVTVA
jgi:hypothetical protein